MKKYGWITLIALCVLLLVGVAWASTTQTPAIDWQVLGGGGGHLEQGNVSLDNTLGQPVVGTYSGGNAELCVGFWCQLWLPEEPGQAPVAGFTATPRQGELPLTVTFTDTSSFTPTQWLWSFGDGDTAGVQNPTHTYADAGVYTVSLTVSNTHGGDSLVKPNHITVTGPVCYPVLSATVSGPTTGLTDTLYSFVATISPPTATTPITYTWAPEPDVGQGSGVVSYTWATTGTQTLSLTISNCGGAGLASDAHQIEIIELPSDVTPVTGVSVQGPTTGTVATSYTFSASVEPPTATTPITYTWTPEPDSGQGSDTASYSWAASGPKTIAVTAQNEGGGAADDHQIEVSGPTCVPLTGVSVSGPIVGEPGESYDFSATVEPSTATSPISYTWTPEPDAGQGSDVATYSWALTGTQALNLTVSNCDGAGNAQSSHAINIGTVADYHVYIPVVIRASGP